MAAKFIADTLKANPVVVFSKTYCPCCTKAKAAFKSVGVKPLVVELDERDDGPALQSELGRMTGASSVPRVFVAGAFIGGGDDTAAAASSGKLAQLCRDAGALA